MSSTDILDEPIDVGLYDIVADDSVDHNKSTKKRYRSPSPQIFFNFFTVKPTDEFDDDDDDYNYDFNDDKDDEKHQSNTPPSTNTPPPNRQTPPSNRQTPPLNPNTTISLPINQNISPSANGPVQPPKKRIKQVKLVNIDREIKTLDDLIELGQNYRYNPEEMYSVDMRKLQQLVGPLVKLKNMIGMHEVKRSIVNQLVYFLAGLSKNDDFMHTVIEGPPGCGKTTTAMILAEIYHALGFVSRKELSIVKRSDLVAGYLGQTTLKTQKAIDAAMGGVLFIDEAYSLGHKEGRDSFSKEIIDTLNQNLSEHKGEFICIIAGYREELDSCFFSFNPGLKRRFPFRYTIEKYKPDELRQIFIKKVGDEGWFLADSAVSTKFFTDNIRLFPYSGGDMETLLHMAKLEHSKRIFGKHNIQKRVLTKADIDKGFEMFRINEEIRQKGGEPPPPSSMYN